MHNCRLGSLRLPFSEKIIVTHALVKELIGLDSYIKIDTTVYLKDYGCNLQRETNCWSLENMQAYVKAVISGSPLTAFLIYQWHESMTDIFSIIDGAHRIQALKKFVGGEFSITINTVNLFFYDLTDDERYYFLSIQLPVHRYSSTTRLTDKQLIEWFLTANHKGVKVSESHLNDLTRLLDE